MTKDELNKDLPLGATPYTDDISGLKLEVVEGKILTRDIVFDAEAENIRKTIMKYFSDIPDKEIAPFDNYWIIDLHKEMLGDVWEWAGTTRKTELSIGIEAFQIATSLKNLSEDLLVWRKFNTYEPYEIAARLHHRAVNIHPFLNGNGRWSRMLANIFLAQEGLEPVKWQENELAKDNEHRAEYIAAIQKADSGDFTDFITFHLPK